MDDLSEARTFFVENGGFIDWLKLSSRDIEIFIQYLAQKNISVAPKVEKFQLYVRFTDFLIREI